MAASNSDWHNSTDRERTDILANDNRDIHSLILDANARMDRIDQAWRAASTRLAETIHKLEARVKTLEDKAAG